MSSNQKPSSRSAAQRSQADPTLVRNQSSLTTASGAEWLIIGALFVLIGGVVLVLLRDRGPAGLALITLAVIVVIYLAMVVVRLTVRLRRLRLGLLAGLLGLIALSTLASVLVIAAAEGA